MFFFLLVQAVQAQASIHGQLAEWAAAWQDVSRREAVLDSIRHDVQNMSFGLASTYASWAADLSNSAGNYAVAATILESVAMLPECLVDLKIMDELQIRCPQKMFKIAIQKLFSMGDSQSATEVWKRARSLFRGSTRFFAELLPEDEAAIPWPSALETPTIWIRGLRQQPFWDCHQAWPFVRNLEAHAEKILAEASQAAPQLQKAYPYLFAKGSWQNLFLFRGRSWNAEVCAAMPQTCQLLLPEIPTKPGLPLVVPNNEEIVLFRSVNGAYVGPHSGAANNQINIHLTLKGGSGVTLNIAGESRELQAGKAICFQDSYLHSLEHKGDSLDSERVSLVVRVLHPDSHVTSFLGRRTEAEGSVAEFSEAAALRAELARLRDHYRRLAGTSREEPCKGPQPTQAEVAAAQEMFDFLSSEFNPTEDDDSQDPLDAIVVLSNWYDRVSKVKKVLELAARHRSTPIILVGGRGRLSSIRAAELDGEAHATLAQLLVLLEIPGELGAAINSNRVVAISCNECPTEQLRLKCGCVGNTGFNADRFLEWAAMHLPPLHRPRMVAVVEESYLVRRVAATVLGRLSGFGDTHVHNHSTMQIRVLNSRDPNEGLQQMMEVHGSMPSAMLHLMASEVVRLDEYSRGEGSPHLFPREFVLGDIKATRELATSAVFQGLLGAARDLSVRHAEPMERAAGDRRLFWRCVAPRDLDGPAAWAVPEAPGEAWGFWREKCEKVAE
ncbi:unnamed protein product, partial [Effrenium voratum]